MKIPDPIERGEARAERFEDRIQGDTYTCSCGKKCNLSEVEAFSPDPYAEPYCPECIRLAMFERKLHSELERTVTHPDEPIGETAMKLLENAAGESENDN